MKILTLATLLGVCLCACTDNSVPYVKDPDNVVVDGVPMTQDAFIDKYCVGKFNNETCIRVQNARSASFARSKTGVPRF